MPFIHEELLIVKDGILEAQYMNYNHPRRSGLKKKSIHLDSAQNMKCPYLLFLRPRG